MQFAKNLRGSGLIPLELLHRRPCVHHGRDLPAHLLLHFPHRPRPLRPLLHFDALAFSIDVP